MRMRRFGIRAILLVFSSLLAGCGTGIPSHSYTPNNGSLIASSRSQVLTFEQKDFRRYNAALDADIERKAGSSIGYGGWLRLPFERKAPLQEYLNAKYYRSMYQDDALCNDAQRLVTEWANTTSGTGFQAQHREAWEWIAAGRSPRNDLERVINAIRTTRLQRWARLGERVGMVPPQAFRLYRGVNSTIMIDAVVQAWQNETATTCILPLRTLSSWSMSEKAAVEFSAAYGGSNEKPWAVFEATVPFEQTLLDKWVDGSDFATQFPGQAEVVVATRQENELRIDEKAITIYYQQKVYRYADRKDFIRIWASLKGQAALNL